MFKDEKAIANAVADEIVSLLKDKPSALICVAAGSSSTPLFEALIERYNKGEVSFKSSFFVAMDEWLDMNITVSGSCGDFLTKSFFSKVDYAKENIRLVDGKASDLDNECKEIYDYIETQGGIDYIVLGVGMNGHLALNEPGVSFDESVHVTKLDPVTSSVGQKYFQSATELKGGVTIGISDIKKAKRSVLMVFGEPKVDVVAKLFAEPVSNNFPASVLKDWEHSTVYYDEASAKKL